MANQKYHDERDYEEKELALCFSTLNGIFFYFLN